MNVFDAPHDGAFESGMRELDAPLPQHGHHLPVEYNAHGQMLTCRNGCSSRFWLDAGEPLQGAQKGAPE